MAKVCTRGECLRSARTGVSGDGGRWCTAHIAVLIHLSHCAGGRGWGDVRAAAASTRPGHHGDSLPRTPRRRPLSRLSSAEHRQAQLARGTNAAASLHLTVPSDRRHTTDTRPRLPNDGVVGLLVRLRSQTLQARLRRQRTQPVAGHPSPPQPAGVASMRPRRLPTTVSGADPPVLRNGAHGAAEHSTAQHAELSLPCYRPRPPPLSPRLCARGVHLIAVVDVSFKGNCGWRT